MEEINQLKAQVYDEMVKIEQAQLFIKQAQAKISELNAKLSSKIVSEKKVSE